MPIKTDFDRSMVEWLNDDAPRGYLITDLGLAICGWNRWLEQSTGRTSETVLGEPLFKVFPELQERHLDRFYHAALQGESTIVANRFHKYLVRLPSNPEYELPEMQQSARIAPLLKAGVVIGTITLIDDVSERVVREKELLAATEAAEKANQAKDRFLAVLAHDLRTPLTAILGWARLLRSSPEKEQIVSKGAAVIERNAEVQIQLIEQILDLSRIAAAKLELNIEMIDIQEIILTTIESLEPLAEAKNIRIRHELPRERRTAALDPNRFQQIIWNLFSNAVKFTPPGGWIRATLQYCPDGFQVTIADSGKGINAENAPHLFEPLWQAEGSSKQGGLGLGLAIVKNLVELHGGSIRAESAGTGQGAAFIVEMPWARPETSRSAPLSPSTAYK
jgi:signal transduction histidine kinase